MVSCTLYDIIILYSVTEVPKILLHLSEESESIQYGNTITLKAEIKACPAPSSIHWKKKDKDGKIEEIIERSGKFVIDKSYTNCQKLCIKNLDLSDNGDYEIIVTNDVGKTQAAIEIKVEGKFLLHYPTSFYVIHVVIMYISLRIFNCVKKIEEIKYCQTKMKS